jgi:hypothetical protein
MRVLLLALMIALLPVRGWVGNAMAVGMAPQQALAIAAPGPASAAHETPAMPPDCPMHAQTGEEETPAGTYCSSCTTCQLCLALASFTWGSAASAVLAPHAGPSGGGERFSSADGSSRLKPPIF